jgi:hypothetical protein
MSKEMRCGYLRVYDPRSNFPFENGMPKPLPMLRFGAFLSPWFLPVLTLEVPIHLNKRLACRRIGVGGCWDWVWGLL